MASPIEIERTFQGGPSRPSPLPAMRSFDDLPVSVLSFEGSGLIDANHEWAAISGLDVSDSAGDGWLKVIHPDDRMDLSAYVEHNASESRVPVSVRVGADGRPDEWFRAHVHMVRTNGVAKALLTLTAVGPDSSRAARLVHMATHDGLTGLANRTRFVGRVDRALADPTTTSALLFIDLDHFKIVNDHLGHAYGDIVLQAVCKRIEAAIRPTDLAGRLGGDEIAVFCPKVAGRHEVISLAERVGAALAAPFSAEKEIVIIDASIGIAFTTDNVRSAEELIDEADRAMYVAKSAGGGRWATYDDESNRRPAVAVRQDLMLGAIRADVDQAEGRTLSAWQVSTANRDFERSARLVSVRAALRRASLLLRTSPDVDIVTTVDALAPDPRPDQLQAAHNSGVAVAQATGMIAQRSGADATESAALLHEYATTNKIAFVIAARMIVERAIDIDTVVAPFGGSDERLQPSGTMPDRGLEQIAAKNWLARLRNVYGDHSAAVFGCAAFICGDAAAKVTERVFVTFWEQGGSRESSAAAVRIQLLTITHRLAMNAALSVTRKHDERSPSGAESPSDVVAAVLSRGQAIERTLACAALTPPERYLAALVIYGRCTYHEVARILDVPADAVSPLLRTGLLHVRTELAAMR
ncbi:MAG: diguanylate cyclase [Ilumatobacteraceae bacterium]|nr:diguanylate cyclase [Ilumatobacteraceae bacterium]